MTLSGTAAPINTALASASYTGGTNFYGTDTLTATTTDGAGSSGAKPLAITVADTTTVSGNLTGTLSGNENTALSLAG